MTALHYKHVTGIRHSLDIRIRFDFLLSKQIFYNLVGKREQGNQNYVQHAIHHIMDCIGGHYGCAKPDFIQTNNLRKVKYV
jgi:hypothetical protein